MEESEIDERIKKIDLRMKKEEGEKGHKEFMLISVFLVYVITLILLRFYGK